MRVCSRCDRPAVFARELDYLCMKHATEAVGAGVVGYRLLEPETPDNADTLPAPALELERAPTRWRRRRAARARDGLWRRHLLCRWLRLELERERERMRQVSLAVARQL